MAQSRPVDPTYPQLEKALYMLAESTAKINFLQRKVGKKVKDLEEAILARTAQIAILLEDQIIVVNEAASENERKWKLAKDRADSLSHTLESCEAKCVKLQARIRELIAMKDTLLCESLVDIPSDNVELLPQGTRIERMVMELKMESSECSICTEKLKKKQRIWSCRNCYNIFHLECANMCMEATQKNRKWACPYCRGPTDAVAGGLRYKCFCGRKDEPESLLNVTPHSCGRKCRNCSILCHPGPC